MAQQYFYDRQIRRWLLQFMRIFGGFSVQMGNDAQNNPYYQSVPVRYGDTNRMGQHILRKNSENTILSVPAISCYIAELVPAADRRMNPTHQDAVQVYEKAVDPTSGLPTNSIGETYTLERHSPIPYDLTINVDIWTSNTEQKLQLLEQILLLFNPSVNLQSSQNPYDWTSLAVVELVNITWTARSIPQGTDDIIDVASLIFSLPIFLTPPAKVKRQVLIHSILNSINVVDTNFDSASFLDNIVLNEQSSVSREWITFQDRHIRVAEDYIQLLNSDNSAKDNNSSTNSNLSWKDQFQILGGIQNGISEIRLKLGNVLDPNEVILKVSEIDGNENILSYTMDNSTLPIDTITMVNGIIDPQKSSPGTSVVPPAAVGQRYLLANDMVQNGLWNNIVAYANDIIEYNGSAWIVSFNSKAVNSTGYTTNANTMKKLYFNGTDWVLAIEGIFEQGWWRVVN